MIYKSCHSTIKRWISNTVFPNCKRIPLLEELVEMPALKRTELDHDTSSYLKNYQPPLKKDQIEAVLSAEFGRHIVQTAWSNYDDPLMTAEQEQAARLIQYTMTAMKETCKQYPSIPKDIGKANDRWIQEECNRLLMEIETGSTTRWTNASNLIGKKRFETLTEEQKKLTTSAIGLLGNNPNLHPLIKTRILNGIIDIVIKIVQ